MSFMFRHIMYVTLCHHYFTLIFPVCAVETVAAEVRSAGHWLQAHFPSATALLDPQALSLPNYPASSYFPSHSPHYPAYYSSYYSMRARRSHALNGYRVPESSHRGLLEWSPRCECCIHSCSVEQLRQMCPSMGFAALPPLATSAAA